MYIFGLFVIINFECIKHIMFVEIIHSKIKKKKKNN